MTPDEHAALQRVARHSARLRVEAETWLLPPARACGDAQTVTLAAAVVSALEALASWTREKRVEAESAEEGAKVNSHQRRKQRRWKARQWQRMIAAVDKATRGMGRFAEVVQQAVAAQDAYREALNRANRSAGIGERGLSGE